MNKLICNKPKRTFGSITLEILHNLFAAMDGIAMHNVSRYQAYDAINKAYVGYSRSQSARVLGDLRRRGYVRMSNASGNASVEFTTKAKMKLIDTITAQMATSRRFHFVSFDLPQVLRLKRDKFRRAIKKIGFVQIQQSLWVINKDIGELVQEIAHELGIEQYIVYMVSNMSDIDSVLKKKFEDHQGK